MSDTVELWTLRDENADLRQQLAEAQRQRDEAQAANAAIGQIWIEEGFSLDSLPSSGRDFLARLEAAQRTIQAADGLYKVLMECSDDLRSDPDIAAALAAYQATKEQK